VFKNRVLSKIPGSKMDKVIGGSRKLHSAEFVDLQVCRMEGGGGVVQLPRIGDSKGQQNKYL
jgi:hypothetical protein